MTQEELKAQRWKFLGQYLADPSWTERDKQKKKDLWLKEWGDKPWEEKAQYRLSPRRPCVESTHGDESQH